MKVVETNGTMAVMIGSKNYTVPKDHRFYKEIRTAIASNDEAVVKKFIDIGSAFTSFSGPGFSVQNGTILYEGEPFPQIVVERVFKMMGEGIPNTALQKFLVKLKRNESPNSRTQTLEFCAVNGFQILEDGNVLAYKGVRDDFKDQWTGTFDNSPGKIVKMDRAKCVEDKNTACAPGLHISTLKYANGYGSRTVSVSINPKDFVSVPEDGNGEKVRVCEYKVLSEVPRHNEQAIPVPDKAVYKESDMQMKNYIVWTKEQYRLVPAVGKDHVPVIMKTIFGEMEFNVLGAEDEFPLFRVIYLKDGEEEAIEVRAPDDMIAEELARTRVKGQIIEVIDQNEWADRASEDYEDDEEEYDYDYFEDDVPVTPVVAPVKPESEPEVKKVTKAKAAVKKAAGKYDKMNFTKVRSELRALGRKLGKPLFKDGMDKNEMIKLLEKNNGK